MDVTSEASEVTDVATVLEAYQTFLDEVWDPDMGLGDWWNSMVDNGWGAVTWPRKVVRQRALGAGGTGAQ